MTILHNIFFLVGKLIQLNWKVTKLNYLFFAGNINVSRAAQGYFGTKIGDLTELHHALSGTVYAVDSRTLFLKNFNYDGEGPGKNS